MAGYSATPLAKKLGIREADDVAFPNAPNGFRATLGELPDGVRVKARATGPLDVIVLTVGTRPNPGADICYFGVTGVG
jgi:hypothetical protein